MTRKTPAILAALAMLAALLGLATPASAAPPKPTSCAATLQADGSVVVSWTASSSPTTFHVREYGYPTKVDVDGSQRSVVWPHPINDDPADFAVRAVDATGSSAACITAKIATTPTGGTGTNQPPVVDAGPDLSVVLPDEAILDGTVVDDGIQCSVYSSPFTVSWFKQSGPGDITWTNRSNANARAAFAEAGTYVLRLEASDWCPGGDSSDTMTVTVTEATPPPPPPPPPPSDPLPYSAGSYFKSRVDGAGVTIDETLTSQMHAFLASHPDQGGKGVTWPKLNQNPGWSGHNYVHRPGGAAPIWKLTGTNGSMGDPRLDIVKTQGIHITDDTWDSVPTGTQDRLLVLQDHEFGYTVQCADVVPDRAARTWSASNCGILWHSSNGLDARNPRSDDPRNFTSRGRIVDAMQIPREEIDRAVAAGTGVGHVLHLFWVETSTAHGFTHPMVADEDDKLGWGAEGWRLRVKPSVDLVARGLTGAALAIARTLQEHGAYIGDNSGSPTQVKIGPPEDSVGTNITTDAFRGKLLWTDFEVITPEGP